MELTRAQRRAIDEIIALRKERDQLLELSGQNFEALNGCELRGIVRRCLEAHDKFIKRFPKLFKPEIAKLHKTTPYKVDTSVMLRINKLVRLREKGD